VGNWAGIRYRRVKGKSQVVQISPEPVVEEEKSDWVPRVGEDTRDLRDPQKIGQQILARVKRKKK
jgi:hypothetical protein